MSKADISRLETAALVALQRNGYAIDRQTYLAESGNLAVAVRAILEAMREPTKGMLKVGGDAPVPDDVHYDRDGDPYPQSYYYPLEPKYALAAWQAMIDHLLSE